MAQSTLITLSVVGHVGVLALLGTIESRARTVTENIEVVDLAEEKQEKKTEPPPPAEVPPEPVKAPVARAAAPLPAEAAPTEAPEPSEQAAADAGLPDFGLSLSGSGDGGIAVPSGGAHSGVAARPRTQARTLSAAPAARAEDACDEPQQKPKPISVPQPVYTEAARSQGIEGKVRVELTVDANGTVTSVRVLQGLGYGLDEAALAAARAARFSPALRCGKPTSATFTISVRFSAS
jgi:protein TonB